MRRVKIIVSTLLLSLLYIPLFAQTPDPLYSYFRNYGSREFEYKKFEKGLKFAILPAETFNIKTQGNLFEDLASMFKGGNQPEEYRIDQYLHSNFQLIFPDFEFQPFNENHSLFTSDAANMNTIITIAKENSYAKKIDAFIKAPRLSYRNMKPNKAMYKQIKKFKKFFNCDYVVLNLTSVERIKGKIGGEEFLFSPGIIETQIWDCTDGKQIYSGKIFMTQGKDINTIDDYLRQLSKESVEFMQKMLKIKRKSKKATGMFN